MEGKRGLRERGLPQVGNFSHISGGEPSDGSRIVRSPVAVEAFFHDEGLKLLFPETPWDVMVCQNHLFGGLRGVTRRVWCFHRRDQES